MCDAGVTFCSFNPTYPLLLTRNGIDETSAQFQASKYLVVLYYDQQRHDTARMNGDLDQGALASRRDVSSISLSARI